MHKRRGYISLGMAGAVQAPISYLEMTAMADGVLRLHGRARELFFTVIEATDAAVLADASEAIGNKPKNEDREKEKN